jgi:hypothetical protein
MEIEDVIVAANGWIVAQDAPQALFEEWKAVIEAENQ